MSKNLTRKGLALGAVVALGSTLFAGAPAFAADEVTLAPAAGSLYKTISGEAFVLNAGIAPSVPAANISQLKYLVTSTATPTVATNFANTSNSTTGQATDTTVYKPSSAGDRKVAGDAATITLTASAVSGTPATATVVAFLDANGDDLLTAGEYNKSQTVTWVNIADVTTTTVVTAPVVGDTTATATVQLVGINTQNIAANKFGVAFGNGYGGPVSAATSTTTGELVSTSSTSGGSTTANTIDATTGVITAKTATFAALEAGEIVKAQLVYTGGNISGVKKRVFTATASGANTTVTLALTDPTSPSIIAVGQVASLAAKLTAGQKVVTASQTAPVLSAAPSASLASGDVVTFTTSLAGTAATATAVASTVGSLEAWVVAGPNAIGDDASTTPVTTTGSASDATSPVRPNSAVTVKALVKDTATTKVALAGVPVKATFSTTATLSATSGSEVQVIVNGKTYSVGSDLTAAAAALTLTSDSKGEVSVTINTVGFTTEDVVVTFTAQNFIDSATTDAEAAVYKAVDVNDVANVGNIALVKDGTAVVNYSVVDQYKVAPADGTFRMLLAGASNSYQPVVGGKASFTVKGGSTDQAYTASLENYVSASASYNSGYTEGTGHDTGFSVVYKSAADVATVGSLTLTTAIAADGQVSAYASTTGTDTASNTANKNNLIVSSEAFAALDTRLSNATAPTLFKGYKTDEATAGTSAGNGKLTLTVAPKASDVYKTASDATVTVSGKGVMFVVNGVYALDTITFIAAAAGTGVDIYSHVAGANVITVKSGSVSTSVTLGYKAVAAQAKDVTFAGVAKTTSAGRAFNVKATVLDQWGNVVKGASVALSTSGDVGYLTNEAAQTTNDKGQVSARLILGASENGVTDVTATLDLATDVVVTQALLVGVSAKITKAATSSAVVKNALGATIKVVRGSKTTSKVASSDSYKVSLKGGSGTVKVYVNDILVASKK